MSVLCRRPARPSVRSPPRLTSPRHVRCRRPAAQARRAAAHRVQHHAHAAVPDDQGDRRVHGAGEGERPVPVRHRQEGEPVHGEGRLRHTIGATAGVPRPLLSTDSANLAAR